MAYIRTRTPVPDGVPSLRVISYALVTKIPCGISNDRKTLYSFTGSTLFQSVDDGVTWTTVNSTAFTTGGATITGIIETDDGEALLAASVAGSTPGYIYKSSGWAASHTAATWSLKLTTTGGLFRLGYVMHPATMGNDLVRAGTSRYGVVSESGSQTSGSGDQTLRARRVYFTSDYGATWTQVFDIYTFFGNAVNVHIHGCSYDPWWDRIWVCWGDTQQNSPLIDIVYSDDHGATWTQLAPPPEWSALSPFQETVICPTEDALIIGSDSTPCGILRLSRQGFRVPGKLQIQSVQGVSSGSELIYEWAGRARNLPGAPLLMGDASTNARRVPGISIVRDNLRVDDIWQDLSLNSVSAYGVRAIYGPTYNGFIVAQLVVPTGIFQLVGELISPEPGMYDYVGQFTGDGTTTVFNIPHGLAAAPSTYQAWAMSAASATGTITVTVDATNIICTFAVAPVNTASVRIGARAR